MLRLIAFMYGLAAYLAFVVAILYAIGFSRTDRAENDRHRTGSAACGGAHRQSPVDGAVRHPAQRDGAQVVQAMVDAIRSEVGRAPHLCAAGEPSAAALVLAMAANPNCALARR